MLRAVAVTGIQNDAQLHDIKLKKLFEKDNISLLDYKKYYDSLDLSLKRTTFYQGIASVTPKFLILYLNGIDKEEKKLVINQSTSKIANINQHLCGISFSVLISE